MADRRFVTALVGVLVALLGTGIIVLSLLALQDPTVPAAEGGPPTDLARVLVAVIALGVLLVIAGASTAVALVRTQLHERRG